MRFDFIIDGTDFSKYIDKYGYSVSYEKREGGNGGMMLDGSEKTDIRAYKAVVTAKCNDLPSGKLSGILSATLKDEVEATYFDTKTNANRTATFIPDISQQDFLVFGNDGLTWFTGTQITLREK